MEGLLSAATFEKYVCGEVFDLWSGIKHTSMGAKKIYLMTANKIGNFGQLTATSREHLSYPVN